MPSQAVAAYEAIAGRYGELERANRILAYMRRRSLAVLLRAMPEGGRLLELGAGGGEEAAAVSRARNASVLAVEPSPGLALAARDRTRGAAVEVKEATASEALKASALSGDQFDGAWSSFALGYDAPLGDLRPLLAAVLRASSPLVLSLRNPWCLAEPWSVPLRATGRYRHKVGASRVPLRHYSRRRAAAALRPDFRLEEAWGLPALVPPPRYGAAWNRLGRLADKIERWDERLSGRGPLPSLGDHTLLLFRRA